MTKYLALFKMKDVLGFVFYSDLGNFFEFSSVSLSLNNIESKIEHYRPDICLYSSLQSVWANHQIKEISQNFLSLQVFPLRELMIWKKKLLLELILFPV